METEISSNWEYLNASVWVRLGPSKYGVGVFAIRDIPKSTLITDWIKFEDPIAMIKISKDDLPKIEENVKKIILDQHMYRSGFEENEPAVIPSPNCIAFIPAFLNHSDYPNCTLKMETLRPIKKDEELTINYLYDNFNASKTSLDHHYYLN